MKVYVCFLEDDCEGQFGFPYRDKKHPWIAFTDEDKAKEWVKRQLDRHEEEWKRYTFEKYWRDKTPYLEAGYEVVEIQE